MRLSPKLRGGTHVLGDIAGLIYPPTVAVQFWTCAYQQEAVVFYLVQPHDPSGRLLGWARQAELAEVGEGYATQQHAV
jgi:hypothetical protein